MIERHTPPAAFETVRIWRTSPSGQRNFLVGIRPKFTVPGAGFGGLLGPTRGIERLCSEVLGGSEVVHRAGSHVERVFEPPKRFVVLSGPLEG